jgi:ABC-type dipeptide/oligopeptide/nickel transport system permease component
MSVHYSQSPTGTFLLTIKISKLYIGKLIFNLIMETVTIPKEEYEELKKLKELDFDLIRQFASSLEDLKQGRFKKLA